MPRLLRAVSCLPSFPPTAPLSSLVSLRSLHLPTPSVPNSHSETVAPKTTPHVPGTTINHTFYPTDKQTNTTPALLARLPRALLHQPAHPLSTVRALLQRSLDAALPSGRSMIPQAAPSPIVTPAENFDDLDFPPDHPARRGSDTYYLNAQHLLRTHTSAHERALFAARIPRWTLAADVYRRDEIDRSHYPVFHQMEGACLWNEETRGQIPEEIEHLTRSLANIKDRLQVDFCPLHSPTNPFPSSSHPSHPSLPPVLQQQILTHLRLTLTAAVYHLFSHAVVGPNQPKKLHMRWIEASFPWTQPSFELEVWHQGAWLEVLGCGQIQQSALRRAGVEDSAGWAFGIGLDRLAMVLFAIPDIRLFWSTDPRFLSQFTPLKVDLFKPFSKFPPVDRDISFWLPLEAEARPWHDNDLSEIVRDIAGDLCEKLKPLDVFTHPKTGRISRSYRIRFRSVDQTLLSSDVNALMDTIRTRLTHQLHVEFR